MFGQSKMACELCFVIYFTKLLQKNTLILLDEYISYWGWKENVFKAWKEYVNKHNIKYKYILFGKGQGLVRIINV